MKKSIVFMALLSVLLLSVSFVDAATNSLSGGISLGANYDSNVDRAPDNEVDQWETTVTGHISLTSQGEKGALSLRYGQTLNYNERTDETSWDDHRLIFDANRELSEHLRLNLANTFVKTNDLSGDYLSSTSTGIADEQNDDTTADSTVITDPTFSDKIGRQKFWSNNFSTSFAYEYTKNSNVILGYTNRILEYDESGKDNYKYNQPSINLSYWFNPQWNSSLSYSYTDAEFDVTEDSITHAADFNLNYVHSVQNTLFGGLSYNDKNYENLSVSRDYYTVGANLGWTHNFSPKKTLTMSAGPEYVDRDNGDDKTTAFFDINYTNRFENGSWFIGANGGFDDRSFDGAGENLSESQQVRGGVSWQVAKDLSASLGGSIRTDDFLENPLESDDRTYSGTASLSYRLSKWFHVSGRYVYNQHDADINANDYVDHQFFLTVGASRELYRW